MNTGEKITAARESKGMTRYALSKKTGIPYSTLKDAESGRVQITFKNMLLVCKGLKMSIKRFVD